MKDTLQETLAYSWELIESTQPAIYHSGFSTDADNLRLDETARKYAPGVHLVEINLVDNWDPENGRSVDQVRVNAAKNGQKLAGAEVLGAYALQDPELLHLQDGRGLPFCDLAGLRQGADFGQVPNFNWNSANRKAYLNSWNSDNVNRNYAAPSVVV